ncbi:hypothetical protein FACS189475_00790 [Betaproteobacteria bacterium]|nr:hypothetical protein FACS189475_00790 [Betaproteobacteria bacterium]
MFRRNLAMPHGNAQAGGVVEIDGGLPPETVKKRANADTDHACTLSKEGEEGKDKTTRFLQAGFVGWVSEAQPDSCKQPARSAAY